MKIGHARWVKPGVIYDEAKGTFDANAKLTRTEGPGWQVAEASPTLRPLGAEIESGTQGRPGAGGAPPSAERLVLTQSDELIGIVACAMNWKRGNREHGGRPEKI